MLDVGGDIEARGIFAGDRMIVDNVIYRRPLRVAAISCTAIALLATPCAAAGKKAVDWQGATSIETQAASDAANPVCQQLSSNISKRVASIKSLQDAIAKSAAGPPSSVKSALEDMFGTRQPDAKTRDYERKIKAERKSADELNDMMRSSQCTPVDIDAVLANQKSDERAAPDVPNAMPDDLVRTPQPY